MNEETKLEEPCEVGEERGQPFYTSNRNPGLGQWALYGSSTSDMKSVPVDGINF